MSPEVTDRYGPSRTILRDNLKWVTAGFAAVAALLLGTAPLTGLGLLEPGSTRFFVAFAALTFVGLGGVIAMWIVTTAVRPDTTYTVFLRTPPPESFNSLGAREQREYRALKLEFEKHKEELLPDTLPTFQAFEEKLGDAWAEYERSTSDAAARREIAKESDAPAADARQEVGEATEARNDFAKTVWEEYYKNLIVIQNWASYTRLQLRVRSATRHVLLLGAAIVVALAIFQMAVSRTPAERPVQPIILHQGTAPRDLDPGAATKLDPVLFPMNRATLSAPGLAAIGKARDLLRGQPEAALLLVAHTDTMGGLAVNVRLAAQRAQAVQRILTDEGGIAANRIYIAALPQSALPRVTGPGVDAPDNRVVEMTVVRLPAR